MDIANWKIFFFNKLDFKVGKVSGKGQFTPCVRSTIDLHVDAI